MILVFQNMKSFFIPKRVHLGILDSFAFLFFSVIYTDYLHASSGFPSLTVYLGFGVILYILKILFKSCRVFDMFHECMIADHVCPMKFYECLLHHDLSLLLSCFHDSVEVADITFHDDISGRVIIDKYFSCYEIS